MRSENHVDVVNHILRDRRAGECVHEGFIVHDHHGGLEALHEEVEELPDEGITEEIEGFPSQAPRGGCQRRGGEAENVTVRRRPHVV